MARKKATAAGRKSARKSARKSTGKAKGLGRPRIPGTAALDMFFKRDFEARQIFEFLDVGLVKEHAVGAGGRTNSQDAGIANRHLAGDVKFARKFQSELADGK